MTVRKILGKLLQLAVTVLCIYYTVRNIDGSALLISINNTNISYIAGAFILFLLSQVVSSFRLLNIFRLFDYQLSWRGNFKLYAAGLFYNFFLPGGVGGDAYKGYRLHRILKWPTKPVVKMLFLDRAIGFGVLGVLIVLFDADHLITTNIWMKSVIVISMIALGYAITKYFFKSGRIYFGTFGFSVLSQSIQISAVLLIILGMGIENRPEILVWIFLISSAASILSFAGIGVREFLFLSSAGILDLSGETSATVGLWISIIGAIISFLGGYFILFPKQQQLKTEVKTTTV